MNNVQKAQENEKQLENQFRENLLYLEKNNPKLYKTVCQYQPQQSFLGIDELGQYNITCSKNWLYTKDQKAVSDKQIQSFLTHQPCLKTSSPDDFSDINTATTFNEYIHKKINNIRPASENNKEKTPYFPIMLHYGVGLGLHLEQFQSQCNSDLTLIFEPHMDFFYASLFTTNYKALNEKTKLFFLINNSPQHIVDILSQLSMANRTHYLTRIGLFKHYSNEALEQASVFVSKAYYQTVSNNGFLEDECISVSHTLNNIKNNGKFFIHSDMDNPHTAILVASGPSADMHMSLIKQHADKAIIFSCSSSLFLCEELNITPDFHAECERNHAMTHFIEKNNKQLSGQKTHLLALSPAHPTLKSYFKDAIFAIKENDLGGKLSNKYIRGTIFCHANPTAGNAAFAFALAMNFKEIILIGYDCGYQNKEYHHSKKSIYFTHNEPTDQDAKDLTLTSITGREVKTTFLLADSKKYIEAAIQTTPNTTIYNTGNGATLTGTQHLDNIALEKKLESLTTIKNKGEQVEKIILRTTKKVDKKTAQHIEKHINSTLNETLKEIEKTKELNIFTTKNISTKSNIFEHITSTQAQLTTLSKKNKTLSLLFNGLKKSLAIATATQILLWHDKTARIEAYKKILALSNLYLEKSTDIITDYTTHNSDEIEYTKYLDKTNT